MNTEHEIKIRILHIGNETVDCSGIIKWAKTWDWSVGKTVAERLGGDVFDGWESIVVATFDEQYAGFCILEKNDDWGTDLDIAYTPFITAVYVDPKFRGRRISEKLLKFACDFTRSLEFDAVYLISGEHGIPARPTTPLSRTTA